MCRHGMEIFVALHARIDGGEVKVKERGDRMRRDASIRGLLDAMVREWGRVRGRLSYD